MGTEGVCKGVVIMTGHISYLRSGQNGKHQGCQGKGEAGRMGGTEEFPWRPSVCARRWRPACDARNPGCDGVCRFGNDRASSRGSK